MQHITKVKQPEPVDPNLKYTDPDKYIELMMAQKNGSDPYQTVFDEASAIASQQAGQLSMTHLLEQHNKNNPDKQITPDMLDMDLPPRLINEFKEGKVAPSVFLEKAADILHRPTTVANQTPPSQPNLGDVPGGVSPSDGGSNDNLVEAYAKGNIVL